MKMYTLAAIMLVIAFASTSVQGLGTSQGSVDDVIEAFEAAVERNPELLANVAEANALIHSLMAAEFGISDANCLDFCGAEQTNCIAQNPWSPHGLQRILCYVDYILCLATCLVGIGPTTSSRSGMLIPNQ